MSTFEEAKKATQVNGALVVVHKAFLYYATSDAPGLLQVGVSLAATWCLPAIMLTPSTRADDIPRSQQILITDAQADELVRLGAEDERDSAESREIERLVADRRHRGR